MAANTRVGDSVAVDGCCLTVARRAGPILEFNAVAETLRRTTLGGLAAGDRVNLEPALRVGDPMGGHWVQGTSTASARSTPVEPDGDGARLHVRRPGRDAALRHREGLDRGGRRQPDGHRLRRRELHGRRWSRTRCAVTTLGRAGAGRSRQPGGRPVGKYVEKLVGQAALLPSKQPHDVEHEYLEAYPERRRVAVCAVEEAIEDIRAGRMVVVVDSPDRENEGDLVMAAEHVTPEAINFMATHGRGLICLALTRSGCDALGLPLHGGAQRRRRSAPRSPCRSRRATASRPASRAADRAHTIRSAIDPATRGPRTSSSRATCSRCAPARRRARAHRADRGLGRSGPAGRAHAGRA